MLHVSRTPRHTYKHVIHFSLLQTSVSSQKISLLHRARGGCGVSVCRLLAFRRVKSGTWYKRTPPCGLFPSEGISTRPPFLAADCRSPFLMATQSTQNNSSAHSPEGHLSCLLEEKLLEVCLCRGLSGDEPLGDFKEPE